MRKRYLAAIGGVMIAVAAAATSGAFLRGGEEGSAHVAPGGDVDFVEVTTGDIVSVVSIPAQTVSRPSYTVTAPAAGTVSRRSIGQDADKGDTVATVDGEPVVVPVSSIGLRWLVEDGDPVVEGTPLIEATFPGFGLTGTIAAGNAYRLLSGDLSARASVTGGPAGFDCPILLAPADRLDAEGREIVCAVEEPVLLFEGVQGQIGLNSGVAEAVPVIPVSAVAGGAEIGEVVVKVETGTEIRRVELGATDGTMVEVTSGLDIGDEIATVPPALVRHR